MKPETFFRKTRLKERLEEECDNYVRPIYERYWKEVSKKRAGGLQGYEVYKDHVTIKYCDYDSNEFINIPIGFFIDFDAELKKQKEQEAEAQRILKEKEEEKERLQEEKFIQFEREQYLRLKEKYEKNLI